MGGHFKYKNKLFTTSNDVANSLLGRVTILENNVYKITYYEIISGASGSLSIPTGATINSGEFSGANCVLSEIDGSNKPTYVTPLTAGGVAVTSTLNTGTGAWVKSGITVSTNVALIYSLNITALDYQNLNNFYIIDNIVLSTFDQVLRYSTINSVPSLSLLNVMSDETGSGALVFGTSPVLTTPNIGVAIGTSLIVGGGASMGLDLGVSKSTSTIFGSTTTLSTGWSQLYLGADSGVSASSFFHSGSAVVPSGLYLANSFWMQSFSETMLFNNGSLGTIVFATGGVTADAEALRIGSTKNISISGKATTKVTSPTAYLHLAKAIGGATVNSASLKFESATALLTTPEVGAIEFLTDAWYATITTGTSRKTFAFLESPIFTGNITTPLIIGGSGTTQTIIYKTTSGVGAAGADHIFQVGNNGATEAMRILNSGNVGIGVSPGAKFHVKGVGGANSGIKLETSNGSSYAPIDFTTPSGLLGQFLATGASFANGIVGGDALVLSNQLSSGILHLNSLGASGQIVFSTGGLATTNEGMRISASGRIGVSGSNSGAKTTVPTAYIHLSAGQAAANNAPLKFTTGTNNTTAESGAMEYNNTFHLTNSDTTRRHIVLAPSTTKVTAAAPYANDGYIIMNVGGTDFKIMTTA